MSPPETQAPDTGTGGTGIPGTGAALELSGIGVNFGGLIALEDVSLSVPSGGIVGIIGPNGAGKTTLFNVVCGFVEPSAGTITLDGAPLRPRPHHLSSQGIVRTLQGVGLFRGLSVLENVYTSIAERVGAATNMATPAGTRRDVIEESMALLERLKLADVAHRTIAGLPYGRQRLVELAITLGLKPEVLLLDEPAAGVPSAESHIILDAIDALPKSIGVLIIDHDMDLVFRFAKKITVLVRGAVFAEGTPKEIGANPDVRAVYLGQAAHG